MDVLESVKRILSDNLDIDPTDVTPESTFESLEIDSLDMVELISELEEECDIDFGDPEGLDTVGDLVDYVASLVD